MSYSPEEVRQLVRADEGRRWAEIPGDCPIEIRSKILDYRAKALGIYRDPETEAARARLDICKSTSAVP